MHASILVLFISLLLTASGTAAGFRLRQQPSGPPDPRFGIVETFVNPGAATEAGAGYTRIILRWDVIQPGGPGDWKPANVPDPLIEGELAAGREVVAILIGTPAWAVDPSGSAGRDDPRAVPDMEAWRAFTQRMAQQYRGRIRHWVIWNEPDVWIKDHPGATWAGSDEDYLRLLKTAYLAIKGVDPTLQVHVAGLTYHWDSQYGRRPFLERLLDLVAADPKAAANDYYFDAAVYHLYFNPGQAVQVLAETKAALAAHGMQGKGIWVNETNAPPSTDPQEPPWSPARFPVTLEEQAAFIVQQFALAFAAGAERVEVYKLRNTADHPESIEPYGLLRADDSKRPAYEAFRVVSGYLAGFTTARRERQGEVEAVTFERGGETTTVLWATGSRPVQVRVQAVGPEALVVDIEGRTSRIAAADGGYMLTLAGATCAAPPCMIGGPPVLLVEAAPAGGRSALRAPAVPEPAATKTPAPTPQPAPAVTATPTLMPTLAATAANEPTRTPTMMPTTVPSLTARPGLPPPRATQASTVVSEKMPGDPGTGSSAGRPLVVAGGALAVAGLVLAIWAVLHRR